MKCPALLMTLEACNNQVLPLVLYFGAWDTDGRDTRLPISSYVDKWFDTGQEFSVASGFSPLPHITPTSTLDAHKLFKSSRKGSSCLFGKLYDWEQLGGIELGVDAPNTIYLDECFRVPKNTEDRHLDKIFMEFEHGLAVRELLFNDDKMGISGCIVSAKFVHKVLKQTVGNHLMDVQRQNKWTMLSSPAYFACDILRKTLKILLPSNNSDWNVTLQLHSYSSTGFIVYLTFSNLPFDPGIHDIPLPFGSNKTIFTDSSFRSTYDLIATLWGGPIDEFLVRTFECIRDGATDAIRKTCELVEAQVVFWDMRELLIFNLSRSGVDGEPILPKFDKVLTELYALIDDTCGDILLASILEASGDGYVGVLQCFVSVAGVDVRAILLSPDSVCIMWFLNQDTALVLYSLVFGEGAVHDFPSLVLFTTMFDVGRFNRGSVVLVSHLLLYHYGTTSIAREPTISKDKLYLFSFEESAAIPFFCAKNGFSCCLKEFYFSSITTRQGSMLTYMRLIYCGESATNSAHNSNLEDKVLFADGSIVVNQVELGRDYGPEMSNDADPVGTFGPEVKVRRRPMTKHPNGMLGRYIWDPGGDTGMRIMLKPRLSLFFSSPLLNLFLIPFLLSFRSTL
ncbi:hypothetical protein A4A49_01869 [Nicotiana attenuata]|uniref:PATROL1-like C-terminal domain-containing protein n=1 Tax=Nicotiana attenuata TaxID=49451 RepID=A0A1J6ITN8_NICAT|nr:hypothetical protein A4A49_01869 [Nicotiana attenuata]